MKMSYIEFLTSFPLAYSGFINNMNRTENLYQHMSQLGVFDKVKTFISIGSGYGDLEIKIAKQHDMLFSVVEPTELFFNSFQEKIQKNNMPSALIESVNKPFDQFYTDRQYDLALSIHSWYAFGTDRTYFEKFRALVNAKGKLFINLVSQKSPAAKFSALSNADGIHLTSEVLSEWLTKEGIQHHYSVEHNLRPYELYIANDAFTQAGRDFVSFLLATPWENISSDLKEQALQIMISHRSGNHIDICSGSIFVKNNV